MSNDGWEVEDILNNWKKLNPVGKVYVLELEGGYWYVGLTTDLDNRLGKHFAGEGSTWTRLHKPIRVHEVVDGDKQVEYEKMKEYGRLYGYVNVRGAGFTQT